MLNSTLASKPLPVITSFAFCTADSNEGGVIDVNDINTTVNAILSDTQDNDLSFL